MAKTSALALLKPPPKLRLSDDEGSSIYNQILLRLPQNERHIVFPRLELTRLKAHEVLHEAGDPLKSAYFCNTGMISLLAVFPDGKSVEVWLVGMGGFLGVPLLAKFCSSPLRAVAQTEATALRIDAKILGVLVRECPYLEQQLQQCSQIMGMETAHIGACNQLHSMQQRLGRSLLMCADGIGDTTLPLTQKMLAQMLGARRASVTMAAGVLQRAGFITYSRGNVRITDRSGLEKSSCACYGIMRKQKERWQRDSA